MIQIYFCVLLHPWRSHVPLQPLSVDLYDLREGWQPERIATIFYSENAEEEAVHHEDDSSPDENSNLLHSRV